jgi:hypothetical protein
MTTIKYNSKFRTGAQTLAYAAGTSNLVIDNGLTKSIVLIIGPDWLGVRPVILPSATPSTPGVVNAGANICSEGNNRIKPQ